MTNTVLRYINKSKSIRDVINDKTSRRKNEIEATGLVYFLRNFQGNLFTFVTYSSTCKHRKTYFTPDSYTQSLVVTEYI